MSSTDRQKRQSHFRGQIEKWSNRVEQLARTLLTRKDRASGGIHRRAARNRPLSQTQEAANTVRSKVRARVEHVFGRQENSMGVGLIGFSNGGFVAVAAAGKNKMFSALAVLYGGPPDWLPNSMISLPPTLIIHGEADRVIPITEGEKLLGIASRLGARVELVRVPEADHGFDLVKDDGRSADIRLRVIAFLVAALKKA